MAVIIWGTAGRQNSKVWGLWMMDIGSLCFPWCRGFARPAAPIAEYSSWPPDQHPFPILSWWLTLPIASSLHHEEAVHFSGSSRLVWAFPIPRAWLRFAQLKTVPATSPQPTQLSKFLIFFQFYFTVPIPPWKASPFLDPVLRFTFWWFDPSNFWDQSFAGLKRDRLLAFSR